MHARVNIMAVGIGGLLFIDMLELVAVIRHRQITFLEATGESGLTETH